MVRPVVAGEPMYKVVGQILIVVGKMVDMVAPIEVEEMMHLSYPIEAEEQEEAVYIKAVAAMQGVAKVKLAMPL